MPCSDGGVPYETGPRRYNGLTAEQLEAVLCGVFTVLEDASKLGNTPLAPGAIGDVMARMDWTEIGVTRTQAVNWWDSHKVADKVRREREEMRRLEAERNDRLKKSGLNKLTPAERIALGLD